jgi:quercetin dioxygenase-like cupin family protein
MEAARSSEVVTQAVFQDTFFPSEVRSLPRVEVPVAGVTGTTMWNDERQVVFFVMEENVSFPDHTHCTQSGLVLAGEMTLEIGGRTELYGPGDWYYVPEGTRHRAHFSKKTYLIDFSAAPDRYKVSRI